MSRFDDEGAPLITRSVTARWNLPVSGIQRILRLQATVLKLQWEERRRRRDNPPPDPEPDAVEAPETYDEHGERHHVPPEERPAVPHIDLRG